MATCYASSIIDAPIAKVWEQLRAFENLGRYLPAVQQIELSAGRRGDEVGVIRTVVMQDGLRVREQLVALSDLDHSMSYRLLETSAATAAMLSNYVGQVRLLPVTDGDRTFIEWRGEYDVHGDPEEVRAMIEQYVYLPCIRGLQGLVR